LESLKYVGNAPGREFACIVAVWRRSEWTDPGSSEVVELGDGLSFITRPFCDVADSSGARVGPSYDPWAVDGFCILVKRDRDSGDSDELKDRVSAIFDCILLQGLFYVHELLLASELDPAGIPNTRVLLRPRMLNDACPTAVTPDTARKAVEMSKRYLRVAPKQDEFVVEPVEFRRLWLGLFSLRRGMRELVLTRRIHDYVQAIEALLMLARTQGEATFLSRASELAVGTAQAQESLRVAWSVRCADEHLEPVEPRVGGDIGPIFELTWKMENLALSSYTQLLSDDRLLEHFRTDDSIREYWCAKSAVERLNLWGNRIDLDLLKWISRPPSGPELGRQQASANDGHGLDVC